MAENVDAIEATSGELKDTERDELEPDISLRPHHLTNPNIRDAIRDKKTNKISRTAVMLRAGGIVEGVVERFSSGYFRDVRGYTLEDFKKVNRAMIQIRERIKSLPDDAVVCLDIKPDEICNSCIIGKHCTATNVVTWKKEPLDWEAKEKDILDKTYRSLIAKGKKEGTDFIFRPADSVMFDFDGKPLNKVSNPTPKDVVFNSMLVRLGALRAVA